ncbi:MAG: DUF2490 domain-containing protein [Flavobacteriales bacterium]|jgi:hypothetical protein|nr:DUF2490 domain-containing protein [Flavobacteriales bacterium]
MRTLFAAAGLALAGLAPPHAGAQDPERPATSTATWFSAQLRGRAPGFTQGLLGDHHDRIRLSGELGYRTADNFFAGRQVYAEGGARYKVSRMIDLAAELRHADRGRDRSNRQRVQLTASMDHSIGRWAFDYRLVHQWTFRKNDTPTRFVRNRIGVEYDFPKWKLDPEVSVEFFTRTDHPRGWNYDGVRYRIGTSYRVSDTGRLDATLIHDRDVHVADPLHRMILSIGYTMDLRRR